MLRPGYVLALLPILTDWLDSGHWPRNPRELANEAVVGVVIFAGVRALYRRADQLAELAETDPLTGLGNRRRLDRTIAEVVRRGARAHRPVTLAFVDVDRMKSINDQHGHAVGDEVLRGVARALDGSTRRGQDDCFRLGGDEFAVLFDGAGRQEAARALERAFHTAPTPRVGVSCSVGLVELIAGDRGEDLVRRADSRMYVAKVEDAPGSVKLALAAGARCHDGS